MQLDTGQLQIQSRQLALTTQAIQAIEVLQYSQQELHEFLMVQAEANPLIDVRTPQVSLPQRESSFRAHTARQSSLAGIDLRDISETHSAPSSLREHLQTQVGMTFGNNRERRIALEIAESIEPDGYLRRPLWDIADLLGIPEEVVERILVRIQTFDPVGVGARNLEECLRLQLADRGELTEAMNRLLKNLPLLAKHEVKQLARICGVTSEAIVRMAQLLKKLDPAPGRRFDSSPTLPALPDVLVKEIRPGVFGVEINPELLPRVLIDREYYTEVNAYRGDESTRRFLQSCFRSANWLARQLDQRVQTILKVASEIVSHQNAFFRYGIDRLRPLDLKDVAEAVGVHESTVSRAVANKHMMTPRGLFALKFFFADGLQGDNVDGVATATIRHRIKQMLDNETEDNVFSDEQIVAILGDEGIDIARRTVAKYRMMLNIPSSSIRKRQKRLKSLPQ